MADMKAMTKEGIDTAVHSTAMTLAPDVIASLVLNGDLSKLTQVQQVAYYNALCQRVGLDPATQPFKLLRLDGKIVMYADKGATQQLSQNHLISHDVIGKEKDDELYTVTIRATMPDGRFTVEDGIVAVAGLKGLALANAKMRAMTKAKRRAVLSLLGLGIMDESERDTIVGAEEVPLLAAATMEKAEEAAKSPVVQPTAAPNAGRTAGQAEWVMQCLSMFEPFAKKGDKKGAVEWGKEAMRRFGEGLITKADYEAVKRVYLSYFPPKPAPQAELFDKSGQPVKPAYVPPTPEQKQAQDEATAAHMEMGQNPPGDPVTEKKGKKGKKAVASFDDLATQIEEASKLSVLFTIKGRIEKADITENQKNDLFGRWDLKSASLKGAKK